MEMAETMILGLRLGEGITFERFQQRFGLDARVKFAAPLREVESYGLVEITADRARLAVASSQTRSSGVSCRIRTVPKTVADPASRLRPRSNFKLQTLDFLENV